MQLEETVFSQDEFAEFAEENLVLLRVDFPKFRKNKLAKDQQKQNDALAERYNEQGYFPTILVINENGDVVKRLNYSVHMDANSFISQLGDD